MLSLLAHLISSPNTFTPAQTTASIILIISEESTTSQTAAFLTAFRISGLEESDKHVSAVIGAVQEVGRSLELGLSTIETARKSGRADQEESDIGQDRKVENRRCIVDIVGTGGDGLSTFNVSTCAAIILAACGHTVLKYGGRGSSGCGSADILEQLGVDLSLPVTNLSAVLKEAIESSDNCYKKGNSTAGVFGFLFSEIFNPQFIGLRSIRRELGFRTVFNIIGPLMNPSQPTHILLGASTLTLARTLSRILISQSKIDRAWICVGFDGCDEITPCGATTVIEVVRKPIPETVPEPELDSSKYECGCEYDIIEFEVTPATFGISEHPMTEVCSCNHDQNAEMFNRIISGTSTATSLSNSVDDDCDSMTGNDRKEWIGSMKVESVLDFVVMNASAVLYLTLDTGHCIELDSALLLECAERVRAVIRSGAAAVLLSSYIESINNC